MAILCRLYKPRLLLSDRGPPRLFDGMGLPSGSHGKKFCKIQISIHAYLVCSDPTAYGHD